MGAFVSIDVGPVDPFFVLLILLLWEKQNSNPPL